MRSSTLIAALASVASFTFAAGQQTGGDDTLRILSNGASNNNNLVKKDSNLAAAPARSRHATRDHRALARNVREKRNASSPSHKKRASRCKASSSTPSSSSSSDDVADLGDGNKLAKQTGSPSSSGNSSRTIEDEQNDVSSGGLGDLDLDSTSSFLKIGNIYAGFLPDDGSGGGAKETMSDINKILPAKSAFYGRYAQVSNGKTFDGNQIYSMMDDIKGSGAILQASIMPYGTWYGLTESDNSNAIAIAKVCNDIYKTHGIEVWLRFAHEMNWYQTDGTYSGGVSDFQTGWKVVAQAIEEHAPETKMYWSPNVGSDSDYEKYYPKEGRVDVVGFDWYPQSASESFLDKAKPFHDKYAVNGIKFFQGETGLHYTGSDTEKMQWVKSLSSQETQDAMPNYLGFAWFNYDKFENGRQVDFKIVKPNQGASSGINSQIRSYFSS